MRSFQASGIEHTVMVSPSWVTDPDFHIAQLTLNKFTRHTQRTSATRGLRCFCQFLCHYVRIRAEQQFLYC
ncbi:Uncharacterised protein [Vibrio cholerae]|nr:Uncharacterised protein [Vibrio cholerae]CSB64640.1 Uncharacterised protein [Vibrio cholerae]CSC77428.1 Uncharacterised protein [Vibrio cholerae]